MVPTPDGGWGGAETLRRLATVAAVLASYGLCRLVFNAVGVRLIGPAAVGRISIALSMAVLVSLPVSAGVVSAVSRYLPLRPGGGSRTSLRRWALRTGAAWLALPAMVFVLIYGGILRYPYGAVFAPMVLLWAGLYSLYALCRSEQFAMDAPRRALLLEGAGVALFAVGLAAMIVEARAVGPVGSLAGSAGPVSAWIPLTLYYVPAGVWMVARTLMERPDPGLPAPPHEMRTFATYSLLGSAAGLGVTYSTTVVVSASAGLASAGLCATLLSAAAPLLLAPRTLNSSFLPRLSLLGRTDLEGFAQLCRVHQRFASLLGLGSVGAALALSVPILEIAVGRGSAGGLATSWTLVCIACYAIFRGEPFGTACAALGRARLTAIAAFIGVGVCATLWAGLLPRAGMAGVAVGYMAYTLVVPTIVLVASRRRGLAPPAYVFPSDAVFAVVVVLATGFDLASSDRGRIVLLSILVAAVAHGLWRIRQELREVHTPD